MDTDGGEAMGVEDAGAVCAEIVEAVGRAVVGDETFFERLLVALLARGHVLVEDVPGTGKTLTARTLATALDLEFSRVQFTPDLLPSDVTGTNVFDKRDGSFEFSPGPIFANVVLADEINRAPPKTQAALLEAMSEGQVSADGETYQLPEPFFVIATQNPVEQEGTFTLPEAQRDRFILKTELGYPEFEGAREIIDRRADRTARTPEPRSVIDGERVPKLQYLTERISVDGSIRDYIIELGRATREDSRVDVGVSPRGIQRLFEASRSRALVSGRDFVVPDDVKAVVHETFEHRLVMDSEATVRGAAPSAVVESVLESVDVPAVAAVDG
jgi:MoxR-like ATPase